MGKLIQFPTQSRRGEEVNGYAISLSGKQPAILNVTGVLNYDASEVFVAALSQRFIMNVSFFENLSGALDKLERDSLEVIKNAQSLVDDIRQQRKRVLR